MRRSAFRKILVKDRFLVNFFYIFLLCSYVYIPSLNMHLACLSLRVSVCLCVSISGVIRGEITSLFESLRLEFEKEKEEIKRNAELRSAMMAYANQSEFKETGVMYRRAVTVSARSFGTGHSCLIFILFSFFFFFLFYFLCLLSSLFSLFTHTHTAARAVRNFQKILVCVVCCQVLLNVDLLCVCR